MRERAVPEWTNDAVIQRWAAMPRAALESMEPDGDFAKRHLLNPALGWSRRFPVSLPPLTEWSLLQPVGAW
jgi:hypothetical protein